MIKSTSQIAELGVGDELRKDSVCCENTKKIYGGTFMSSKAMSLKGKIYTAK